MADQEIDVLETSREPRALKRAAVTLARSESPGDQRILGEYLAKSGFLERLDTEEDYEGTSTDLRLARIIKTLMDNRTPGSDRTLLELTSAGAYQGDILRVELLVRALAVIEPSPPPAVAYWEEVSAPDGCLAFNVVEAICLNQSEPALALLERMFADPGHAEDDKRVWMRNLLLPCRNDAPLLASCERMVTKSLPETLRPDLVEALFDYKPDRWYRSCSPPTPPARAAAAPPARRILLRIADFAVEQVTMNPALLALVHAAREELEDERA